MSVSARVFVLYDSVRLDLEPVIMLHQKAYMICTRYVATYR